MKKSVHNSATLPPADFLKVLHKIDQNHQRVYKDVPMINT